MPPGPYVMLAVSDTGVGMSAEVRARIFDPFFTTKEPGKGTGLGLATVNGIIKQSGGFVSVDSEIGKGSTFKLYFPRVDGAAGTCAIPATRPDAVLVEGSETILLVEDEANLRGLTAHYLRSKGYAVLEAGSGSDGLRILKSHPGQIHLLVTDLVMPGLGGRELAKAALLAQPYIPIICISGYTDRVTTEELCDANTTFLQKPFSLEVLATKIRSLLRSTETPVVGSDFLPPLADLDLHA